MSPHPPEEQDSADECPLVEVLQHTCAFEQVDGVQRYVCYPIPRIFRVYVRLEMIVVSDSPAVFRCKGKPAVELTKFVHVDMNTGQVELLKG